MAVHFHPGSCVVSLAILATGLACGTATAQAPTAFGAACPPANGTYEDPTYPIRKLAFEASSAGRIYDARHLMRCAIHANPKDIIALKQEVYLDLNVKDEASAEEDIDALRALGASAPQFEAQEGYLLASHKQYDEARLAFGRAIAGGDPAITAQSMRAIHVLDGEFPRHVLSLYNDSQYMNRFSDGVIDTFARYYERLGNTSPFRLYIGEHLLRDTASSGGRLPQIFSDNALLSGIGVSFQPHGAPYFLSAEVNAAYLPYGSKSGTSAIVPDSRVVAGYYKLFRAGGDRSPGNRLSLEANGSFGFYSRYGHDGIAYLQPREMIDLTREGTLRLRPFLQQSISLDTNQQFYNNVFELIPGFEISNTGLSGLSFRAEYVRGFYLPVSNSATNPYGSTYGDFRFRLLFQRNISFGSGDR